MGFNDEKCEDSDEKVVYPLLPVEEILLQGDSTQASASSYDIDSTVEDVILYPVGGGYNQFRKKQYYLESLLSLHWQGYSQASTELKKDYVVTNILNPIYNSGRQFKICNVNHKNGEAEYTIPNVDVAFERIAQKLRDKKKQELAKKGQNTTTSVTKRKRGTKQELVELKVTSKSDKKITEPSKKRKSKQSASQSSKSLRKKKRSSISGSTKIAVAIKNAAPSSSDKDDCDAISYSNDVAEYIEDTDAGTTVDIATPSQSSTINGRMGRPNRRVERNEKHGSDNDKISLDGLKEIIFSQWDQIDYWKRLCSQLKETNNIQREVIMEQDKLLSALSLSK